MRNTLIPLLGFLIGLPLDAQKAAPPEPRDRSLMSTDEEIAFALTGAPAVVARGAGVYVMSDTGFTRARESKNGYVCIVERGDSGLDRVPICHDRSGAATLLRITLLRGHLGALKKSSSEILDSIGAGYRKGHFKSPEPGGVSYMLAREGYFTNPSTKRRIASPPHMMTYAPYATYADLGAADAASELARQGISFLKPGAPDNYLLIFAVPVSSDTTGTIPPHR